MTEAELLDRLERLERDNRRLKGLALVGFTLAVAFVSIYAARPVPQVIRAHEFDVIDRLGRADVRIGDLAPYGTGINLYNLQGKASVTLSAYEGLTVRDSLHQTGSKSSVTADGFTVQGKDRCAAGIGVVIGGRETSEYLYDAQGRGIFLSNLADVPDIKLSGQHEKSALELSVSRKGFPSISLDGAQDDNHLLIGSIGIDLVDGQGYEMDLGSTNTIIPATGETQQTSADSIVMFGNGRDHRVIWKAP